MAPDGTLSLLGQDESSLKRINIMPPAETNLDTLLVAAR
jgi:hypothetical protein